MIIPTKNLTRAQSHGLKLLMLCLLFCFGAPVQAKIAITSSQYSLKITQDVSYFEDKDSLHQPGDFLKKSLLQQFTPTRTPVFRLGFTQSTLWLRLRLENQLNHDSVGFLYVNQPNLGLLEAYRLNGDEVTLIESAGSMTENLHASVRHRSPLLQLPLAANEHQDFLLRVKANQYLNFTLRLADPNSFYQDQFQLQLFSGLTLGVLLILAFQSIFRFASDRQPVYLSFVFYVLNITLYIASSLGYIGYYWLNISGLQPYLEMVSGILLCVGALQFSRHLFDLKNTRKNLDNIARIFVIIGTALACASVVTPPQMVIELIAVVVLSTVPLNCYITAARALDGYQPARWMLIPCLLFMILGGITAQNAFGILTFGNDTLWLLLFALFVNACAGYMALSIHRNKASQNQEEQKQKQAVTNAERQSKTEFLAQISHEIRTPMNGILGMAELLSDTPLSQAQEDYVKTINTSGSNLLKILDDILDYSKIETGNLNLDITSFDIGSTLLESIDVFKQRANEKNIEFITHIESNVPVQVKGDPTRVRQILANLLSNAIKYTDRGEVSIHISKDEEQGPTFVKFQVSDTGIGISRDQLKSLLNNYDDHLRQLGHHGLGLPISQRLVSMMKGVMGAESQPNRGSTFWFSIPLEPDPDSQDLPLFAKQLNGLRLLIVDDNASCRLVIQQQASSWGMTVDSAANGKQALAMLHNQAVIHEPYDIVILDHEMPGMNGMDLAAKIKEDSLINNAPLVLMLTGLGMGPSQTAARNAGIRRVIGKPVTGRMLKSTLLEELAHLRRIQADHPSNEEGQETLPPMSVLVAEDHHLSQKVIKGMLSRLGAKAEMVDNGRSAVERVKERHFDIILMDCEMPILSGFDAAREIRAWQHENQQPETPIIALTAHIMDEHREHSLECGMNAHLSKPIELSELRDILLQWYYHSNHNPDFPHRHLG